MKAVAWKRYGDPDGLELEDVPKPFPADDEVRVRVRASTVTAGDCEVRSLRFRFPLSVIMRLYVGLFRPKRITRLGQELSGVIDAVGSDVTNFRVGDEVFAQTDFSMGAYAEYRCMRAKPAEDEGELALKPANLSFEEAACVPLGGLEALKYLRAAAIKPGEAVLIIGSAGSIGTTAIQLAKHSGAEVTGVDRGDKLQTMRACGADTVIDYTTEDFTMRVGSYDVVFDVVGKAPYRRLLALLKDGGRLILSNPRMRHMVRGTQTDGAGRTVIAGTKSQSGDLAEVKALVEAGVLRPVVDRTFPLEEIREAHRYVEAGDKKGSLAITVSDR